MSERTNIEWCDASFNPWIGCTKVSPACDHCYAERDFDHRLHVVQWGAGQERKLTGADNWKKPAQWNKRAFYECEVCGLRTDNPMRAQCFGPYRSQHMWKPARRRVFCASLADVFDNEVPVEWLVNLLDLIRSTPHLDWLLLSKRIGNWRTRILACISLKAGISQELATALASWLDGEPPANAWLGATICNQAEADRDIPKLLATPARVRFLSMEPLLGPVDIKWALPDIRTACCHRCGFRTNQVGGVCPNDGETLRGDVGLDWVIVGGESGPKARPMHPDWPCDLRDQCDAAVVPFLFKQWGEWCPRGPDSLGYPSVEGVPRLRMTDAGHNGQDLASPGGNDVWMNRAGKKVAGRLLNGVEHNGFPQVTP